MPQLIFYVESGYPQIHNLLTRKTTIGRNEDNDIHLNDPRISPYHAEIVRKGPGSYQLVDLNSDNGTAVNGKLIDEVDLNDSDKVKFGSANAAFIDQSESDEDKLLRQTVEKDLEVKSERLAKIEQTIAARTSILEAIPESEGRLESLERSVAELEQRNETEKNRLTAVEGELVAARQKRIDLQNALKTQEKELVELDKDRAELQAQYRRIQTANDNSTRLKEELNAELTILHKDVETEKANLKEHMEAYMEAKAVIEEGKIIRARMNEFEVGLKGLKISFEKLGEQIAERENIYAKIGEDIAGRNCELEELNQTLQTKHRAAEELSRVILENNNHIRNSNEMLESMETTLQKEIDEVSNSQETKESLYRESLSLSSLISGKTAILNRLNEKFNARSNGSEEVATCPPLRVVNPALRSLVHYFQHGAGVPDQDRVNPVGFYGLAACTKGSMHRDPDTIPAGDDPVLVMLRGDLDKDKAVIESIARDMPNRMLMVCWSEGQLDALAAAQERDLDSRQIGSLLAGVSGILSVDSRTAELLDNLKLGRPHLNISLPCPVELADWNPPVAGANRSRGIFISASGFNPESKLHRGRLALINQLVAETQISVSLYHPDPADLIEGLSVPAELITDLPSAVKYSDCLAFMRQHRFVTGFGRNLDGGEILGDALLSRTVFPGADFNSVIDQLLFPDSCIKGDDIEEALKNATRLISDSGAYTETIEQAQKLAIELISFKTVSERLGDFLRQAAGHSVAA